MQGSTTSVFEPDVRELAPEEIEAVGGGSGGSPVAMCPSGEGCPSDPPPRPTPSAF
jgi:hypothetical protein